MIRLAKYLKPYLLYIAVSLVLLFVQANSDLALPDYMSRIVNNGIQQGGVEYAVPKAIRQSQMDKLALFLDGEDKARVLEAFTLVDQSSSEYAQTLVDYPTLATEPVYVLQDMGTAAIESLEPLISRPLLAVSFIQQIMDDPSQLPSMVTGMGGDLPFDLSMIPEGTDLFAMLTMMPEAQRGQMTDGMAEAFASMDDGLIRQMAVVSVKDEYVALGVDPAELQNDYIWNTGIRMLLVSLLSGASAVGIGFLSARTAAGTARDLRRALFTKVENFSSTEFNRFSTASLITRTTNDVTQLQMVIIMLMRMVVFAPVLGVGALIRAINKGSSMWWIIALAVGIMLVLIVFVYRIAVPRFKAIQRLTDRLNLVVRESLSGMMVVRAFNRQDRELERFDRANLDVTGTMLFITRVMVVMMPLMMLVMNGMSLLIMWVGSQQVAASNMQVGDMMAFMQYTMQIVFAFLMVSMMFIFLPRAQVSADRIADVLETELVIEDPEEPRPFDEPFRGAIEFRDVSFRYPGAEEDVLRDISFVAQPGQMTAFIGSTGSGKSTIVSLIPRFYDVTEGSVLVDGLDVRDVTQVGLRHKIGYVPQKGTLFSGTIQSNLLYGDAEASEDALRQAADIAQASEFIDSRPEGLDADIAQGGTNVSGGQKQRLSIARALVKQPPIYVFDDSFSALDFKTDAALRRQLKEGTSASTVLIVAQRVSTVKNAEQIIVLAKGKIVGKGTHEELMETCDVYQEIALSQLSLEELS